MKNKTFGVIVKMVRIMKVWGSYVLKRCNKLSLGGSLRGSIEKECNMLKDEQQVKKKENVYVFGKLKPKCPI